MSDYYDIDSILASSVKVPCYFRDAVPSYGFLTGHDEDTLPADLKVDLPFWLAEPLAIAQHIDMDIPKFFGKQVRNDLRADANSVDLRRLCTHFFSFGHKLIGLVDDQELSETLMDAFTTRLFELCQHTQSGSHQSLEKLSFVQGLDETEKDLYRIGLEATAMKKKWTDRVVGKLKQAQSLSGRGGSSSMLLG